MPIGWKICILMGKGGVVSCIWAGRFFRAGRIAFKGMQTKPRAKSSAGISEEPRAEASQGTPPA